MIPKECKRLAGVDFPTTEVSRHAATLQEIHVFESPVEGHVAEDEHVDNVSPRALTY